MPRPCLFQKENLGSILAGLNMSLLQIGVVRGSVFQLKRFLFCCQIFSVDMITGLELYLFGLGSWPRHTRAFKELEWEICQLSWHQ